MLDVWYTLVVKFATQLLMVLIADQECTIHATLCCHLSLPFCYTKATFSDLLIRIAQLDVIKRCKKIKKIKVSVK